MAHGLGAPPPSPARSRSLRCATRPHRQPQPAFRTPTTARPRPGRPDAHQVRQKARAPGELAGDTGLLCFRLRSGRLLLLLAQFEQQSAVLLKMLVAQERQQQACAPGEVG